MEILSPAGTIEAFRAAVENGANAVYIGGKVFNARAFATNFSIAEIEELCDYAHLQDVRVYVTLNILILPDEMDMALNYAKELSDAGVDGLIVQDIGLLKNLSSVVSSDVELHCSTQMTLHNSLGMKFAKRFGTKRVVLSREVSLDNIAAIHKKSDMALESFGHGALCSGWSGQCLMSSILGGRSGNRGMCAQTCRLKYDLVNKNGAVMPVNGPHLFSTKDLCTIDIKKDIEKAGIISLKLEGRLKQPEYVACVTKAYSDETLSSDEAKNILKRCFNRGFTTGYYIQRPGNHLKSQVVPNNQSQVDEELKLKAQSTYRTNNIQRNRKIHGKIYAHVGEKLEITLLADDYVSYVCTDFNLEQAKTSGINAEELRNKFDRFGGSGFVLSDIDIDTDKKCFIPLSVLNELRREAIINLKEQLLYPWKNRAVSKTVCDLPDVLRKNPDKKYRLTVHVDTKDQAIAAAYADATDILIGDPGFRTHEPLDFENLVIQIKKINENIRIWYFLPHMIHENAIEKYTDKARHALDKGAYGLYAGNPGALEMALNIKCDHIALDYSMNVTNSDSFDVLADFGVETIMVSNELTLKQVENIYSDMGPVKEVLVHGRCELMTTEHCIIGTNLGQTEKGDCDHCNHPCEKGPWYIKDRLNFKFPILPDKECRNHIYNPKTHCLIEHLLDLSKAGVRSFRIEAAGESVQWIKKVVEIYSGAVKLLENDALNKEIIVKMKEDLLLASPDGFTKGHYFRGLEGVNGADSTK